MAKYKIVVTRYDDNTNYEAEMAKFKEDIDRGRYRGFERSAVPIDEPSKDIAQRSLEVFLTEEEYVAIKQAVLATFK